MSRQPRFEVVHTGPRQFHARFRAANGEIVWTTETYTRRRTAWDAIELIDMTCYDCIVEVRQVDER
jgi:uncharacterized protein YegP (UPF0339 family)